MQLLESDKKNVFYANSDLSEVIVADSPVLIQLNLVISRSSRIVLLPCCIAFYAGRLVPHPCAAIHSSL